MDPLKSPSENANEFFRRTKKAKNAIALGEENKAKAIAELQECERLLAFALECDEETLGALIGEKKGAPTSKKAKRTPTVKGPLPYVAKIGGQVFYFGKSAKQNDALTFLYATKPSFLWFHPKDKVGAHVILPKEHPEDSLIQLACELALVASGMEDGEVQYAEHRSLRKGSVPGQVILGAYRSAYIKSISPEARSAYEKALEKDNG